MPDEDEWSGVNAALDRFGLPARPEDGPALRAALEEQIRREADEAGDPLLMRLLCAQLFSLGGVEDSLLIWRAKSCNFDTHCGIDVQFLCGAGLDATREFLRRDGSYAALDALDYLARCEADFAGFDVGQVLQEAREFYEVADEDTTSEARPA